MLMSIRSADLEESSPVVTHPADLAAGRLTARRFLLLSAWCGLVAGLLEVAITVVRKRTFDLNHLLWSSRHFLWLVPVTDLAIFLIFGVLLALLAACGRRGRWLAPRTLCALTLVPPIWAASPRIAGPAGLLLALGASVRIVPSLERRASGFHRLVRWTFPVLVGLVPILAAALWGQDWIEQQREAARTLPPPGSPNVLLIVLDTVAAGHLGLYGYHRPTSPTIDELAPRGIRFDRVQAASSWTLPSHANMFTGRWPHELSVGWLTPLDGANPTLAEFLGARGYATAGFVANYWYCARDSGLARGFTVYRDYIFPRLTALKSAVLINRPVDGLQAVEQFLEDRLDLDLLKPAVNGLWWAFNSDRKGAAVINREFLDWLSRRRQADRPFFAFLNYYDAHHPYQLPELSIHRFGVRPDIDREIDPITDTLLLAQNRPSAQQIALARDAYDDCVADLDEQLGRLIDELDRRAILERTWVIIAADHGESFGEHPGVFRHGTSLYQTELHVPLLIIPPAGTADLPGRKVSEPVSLRDLAATIVAELGLQQDSPFPGEVLTRLCDRPSPDKSDDLAGPLGTLSEVVPLDGLNPDPAQLLKPRWPLGALAEGDWKYIRREGETREELFLLRDDPQETANRASDPALRATLERLRAALGRLTAGPLTPRRFKP
jgi:arylsulfatase A-like enzyme